MAESALLQMADRPWPRPVGSSVALTEQGLVFAGGSLLVRMRKGSDGRQELAVGTDRERMLAMLSIAFGRPISAQAVLPHVERAADHWGRGEKALAQLRLASAGLAKLDDPEVGTRVALAACLLDHGWPPAELLEELGVAKPSGGFGKYNHAHAPAGHGRRSGQFDFRSGTAPASDQRIVVAGDESDKEFELRELTGQTNPKEEIEHHHPILPMARAGERERAIATIDEYLPKLHMDSHWKKEIFDISTRLRDMLISDPEAAHRQLLEWEDYTIQKLRLEQFR